MTVFNVSELCNLHILFMCACARSRVCVFTYVCSKFACVCVYVNAYTRMSVYAVRARFAVIEFRMCVDAKCEPNTIVKHS